MLELIATLTGFNPAALRLLSIVIVIVSGISTLGVLEHKLKNDGARELQQANDAKVLAANIKLAEASGEFLVRTATQATTVAGIVTEARAITDPWSVSVVIEEKCKAQVGIPNVLIDKLNRIKKQPVGTKG